MAIFSGSSIVKNELVLNLDAANTVKNSGLTSVEVLIVGGGGGGGFGHGGGGGGGAVLYRADQPVVPGTSYTITVGAGGTGNQDNSQNNQGGSSSAFGVTATGGGSGANEDDASGRGQTGGNGANGGGGMYGFKSGGTGTAPTASGWKVFAGFNGGQGGWSGNANYPTGGGAGAGGPGFNGSSAQTGGATGGTGQPAGAGGPGVLIDILGTLYYWGGGGGGTTYNTGGTSGAGGIGGGGGGSGSVGSASGAGGGSALNAGSAGSADAAGGNAGANTGGGGGAGANENFVGGNGGSGIVVIRYAGAPKATGGTITRVGNDTVHTFTTVGNSTFVPYPTLTAGATLTTMPDLTSNFYIASGVGTPIYDTTFNGNFAFDTDNISVNLTKAASNTFEFWAKLNAGADSLMLFNAGNNSAGPDLFFYSGNIAWNIWDGGGNPFGAQPANLRNGNYHHFVVVNESGVNARLYYDGTLLGTAAYRSASSNTTFTIGGAGQGGGYTWVGNIAIARVYNRALSVTEIIQNYNAARGRFGV